LVEVDVESIRKSVAHGSNVVVMRVKDGAAVLPIWIGAFEAESIAMILQQRAPHRPITHDLALQMVLALGGQVRRVTISRLVDKTFYAEIELAVGESQQVVDARPSDAIALAVRVGAPIFVARAVLDTAGAPSEDEWTERHGPEMARQARIEPIDRTLALQLIRSPGTPNQVAVTLAEFTSSDWPSPQYQRAITWDGRDMLAIALPSTEANPPWLIVPPDFWEHNATTIIRPTAPEEPAA
jgi:bifunctional DNase/RNase